MLAQCLTADKLLSRVVTQHLENTPKLLQVFLVCRAYKQPTTKTGAKKPSCPSTLTADRVVALREPADPAQPLKLIAVENQGQQKPMGNRRW